MLGAPEGSKKLLSKVQVQYRYERTRVVIYGNPFEAQVCAIYLYMHCLGP